MRELTPLAILLGVLIGIVFGAANAYIGLKVGMTISASIPAAVISMAVLRGLLRRGTILENNIVQTVGSVGESLAAGMIFTIPALFIFAYADNRPEMAPSFWEMTLWGALGGLLGVFFMIPLRRMLIVKEHGKLPYPEGTACAEVLEAGQAGGVSAKTVFWGLGVGAVYEFFRGLGFWAETARQRLPLIKSEMSLATEPALLGVGYILGIRVAGYMLGGAVLGWFVIIPAIAMFGADATAPMYPELKSVISRMTPGELHQQYVRYIGAGAVVLGGVVSLLKSLGTIGGSLFHMFAGGGTRERTDRDIPTVVLVLAVAGIGYAMWHLAGMSFPQVGTVLDPLFRNVTVIACVIAFGFFFATVSSRLVGIVGGSSNPASGMTIATLLGTALIITNTMQLDPIVAKVAIISVGALVCICICMAGDTSQDLKTGFLLKATPWKQQIAQMIGVLTATAVLAGVLWLVDANYGFSNEHGDHPNAFLAPQANLMKMLVAGVVDAKLPWELILIGIATALIVEMLGIPSLPFAVGLYLPLSLSTPIMVGGVLRWAVDKWRRPSANSHSPGILAASGLVAGHGLMGVTFVGVAALVGWWWNDPRFVPPKYDEATQRWVDFDPQADAWTYTDQSRDSRVYFSEQSGEWIYGEPPLPATASAPTTRPGNEAPAKIARGERVVPRHFYPWLAKRFKLFEPEYGLRPHRYETGRFTGDYALDWWQLLPLLPFGLMASWLALTAWRREDDPSTGPPAGAGRGEHDDGAAAGGPTPTSDAIAKRLTPGERLDAPLPLAEHSGPTKLGSYAPAEPEHEDVVPESSDQDEESGGTPPTGGLFFDSEPAGEQRADLDADSDEAPREPGPNPEQPDDPNPGT